MDDERVAAGPYGEALAALEADLAGGYDRKLLHKMAAIAWHKLHDPVAALGYLERLRGPDAAAGEARILRRAVMAGWVGLVRKLVRLGLRRAAFEEIGRLRRAGALDDRIRAELEEVRNEHLASPWLRLLRERLRRSAGRAFRMREKDSPVWKLLRKARARSEGGDEAEPPDDPSLLPGVDKESELLRWLEGMVRPLEDLAFETWEADRYLALLEDRTGLEEFEGLLLGVELILRAYGGYQGRARSTVKDYLGSFLPGTLRDKVVDGAYLEVARRECVLEQDFRAFLRRRYPGLPAG